MVSYGPVGPNDRMRSADRAERKQLVGSRTIGQVAGRSDGRAVSRSDGRSVGCRSDGRWGGRTIGRTVRNGKSTMSWTCQRHTDPAQCIPAPSCFHPSQMFIFGKLGTGWRPKFSSKIWDDQRCATQKAARGCPRTPIRSLMWQNIIFQIVALPDIVRRCMTVWVPGLGLRLT